MDLISAVETSSVVYSISKRILKHEHAKNTRLPPHHRQAIYRALKAASRLTVDSPEHRQKELCRFVNFYNTVKPHRSLNGDTPFEVLQAYFS